MKRMPLSALFAILLLANSSLAAQEEVNAPSLDSAQRVAAGPPRLVRYSGLVRGISEARLAMITFAIYRANADSSPLWMETQNVPVDAQGRFTVLLGRASSEGLPMKLFADGEARWLGVRLAEEGGVEQPRVALLSVPYALSAANAETLNGRPASDFALTRTAAKASGDVSLATTGEASGTVNSTANTAGRLAKFTATDTIGDSVLIENAGMIGLGTSPAFPLHIEANSASAALAVGQNNASGFGLLVRSGNDNTPAFLMNNAANSANKHVFYGNGDAGLGLGGGRIGIGTTGPASPLHVQANNAGAAMRIVQNNTNGFALLVVPGNDGTPAFLMNNTANSANRHVFYGSGEALFALGGGNVGIGTNAPGTKLDVVGSGNTVARVTSATAGVTEFSVAVPPPVAIRGDATSATGVTAGVLGISSAVQGRGVLGESLSTTGQNMGVYGVAVNSPDGSGVWGEATSTTGDAAGVFGRSQSSTGTGVFGQAVAASGDAVGVAGISQAAGGTGVMGEVTASTGENYAVAGRVFNTSNASSTAGMFINAGAGSILLGRTSTAGGAANVFRVATNGQVFGSAFNTSGADFAESVAVKEEKSEYVPGDVIAIDTTGIRRFAKVAQPYSTLVAGIYSTKPGILASPHHPEDPRIATQEIPLAVVGIVPCKVTDENGGIQAGDLLVSSSRAGYAMKGTDRSRMNGAVIGKALQPMKGKTGVIEVLVSLQ